jgi:hypothetical protein
LGRRRSLPALGRRCSLFPDFGHWETLPALGRRCSLFPDFGHWESLLLKSHLRMTNGLKDMLVDAYCDSICFINCVGSASSDCGPNLVLLVASTRRHVFCSSCDAPGLAERENLKLNSLAYSSTRVGLALSFPTSLSQTQICAPPAFPLLCLRAQKLQNP